MKRQEGYDTKYWHKLAEDYFNAAASEEEERALRQFLASDKADGREWEEVKAVMGFAVAGRAMYRQKAKRRLISRMTAVAAVAILLLGISLPILKNRDNMCVTYIGGVKYTDDETALAQMHDALQSMSDARDQMTTDAQLSEMFNMMNNE